MGTIGSGTWDTPYKSRSKYKLYDTTVYELVTLNHHQMSDYVRMRYESNNEVIQQWLTTEQGQFLKDRIRDTEVVFSKNHATMVYDCYIRAYMTKEDLLLYTLKFGVQL